MLWSVLVFRGEIFLFLVEKGRPLVFKLDIAELPDLIAAFRVCKMFQ